MGQFEELALADALGTEALSASLTYLALVARRRILSRPQIQRTEKFENRLLGPTILRQQLPNFALQFCPPNEKRVGWGTLVVSFVRYISENGWATRRRRGSASKRILGLRTESRGLAKGTPRSNNNYGYGSGNDNPRYANEPRGQQDRQARLGDEETSSGTMPGPVQSRD